MLIFSPMKETILFILYNYARWHCCYFKKKIIVQWCWYTVILLVVFLDRSMWVCCWNWLCNRSVQRMLSVDRIAVSNCLPVYCAMLGRKDVPFTLFLTNTLFTSQFLLQVLIWVCLLFLYYFLITVFNSFSGCVKVFCYSFIVLHLE